ncbi:hypothetical protein T484DRAFT_1761814, partial [Baffinella frigidus]
MATKEAVGKMYAELAAQRRSAMKTIPLEGIIIAASGTIAPMVIIAASGTIAPMVCTLQALINIMLVCGVAGGIAAREFGRLGGHMMLLAILEGGGDGAAEPQMLLAILEGGDDCTADLAAEAVTLSQNKCPSFPMKRHVDTGADHLDPLLCAVSFGACEDACTQDCHQGGAGVTVHVRRRGYVETGGDEVPVREISNMLWAASVVLTRYLQQRMQLLQPKTCPDVPGEKRRMLVLEVGAGLGVTGLGVAGLAQHAGLPVDVVITDIDSE